jgi:hypothetical protein
MPEFDNFIANLPETFEEMEGYEASNEETTSEEETEPVEEQESAPQVEKKPTGQAAAKQNEQDFKNARFPIEINGKTYMATPEDLVALAKKGAAMDSRARTAGFMERQVQDLMDKIKNADALDLLKERGMTPAQMKAQLEAYYEDLLNEESMSPEQRELRELKRFKEMEEKKNKERDVTEKHVKQEAALRSEQQKLTQELADALKDSKMPKHPFFGKMALQEMLSAHANGHELSMKDAVRLAEFTVRDQLGEFVSQMDTKQLIELLGDKRVKEIRGHSVASVKQNQAMFKTAPTGATPQGKNKSEPIDVNDFFKNLAKRK